MLNSLDIVATYLGSEALFVLSRGIKISFLGSNLFRGRDYLHGLMHKLFYFLGITKNHTVCSTSSSVSYVERKDLQACSARLDRLFLSELLCLCQYRDGMVRVRSTATFCRDGPVALCYRRLLAC